MVTWYLNSNSPELEPPLVKENWEGRQPKTRDNYGSPGKSKSLHPRSKVGRSSADLTNMDSEVEVNYSACKCNLSILLIFRCTKLRLFVIAVEKCKYLSKSVPETTRRI